MEHRTKKNWLERRPKKGKKKKCHGAPPEALL